MARLSGVLDDATAKAEARRTDPAHPGRGRAAAPAGQGLARHGRVRSGRARPRARPLRLPGPAGVRHLRHRHVHGPRRRPALRRQPGPQPRRRRLLPTTTPACSRSASSPWSIRPRRGRCSARPSSSAAPPSTCRRRPPATGRPPIPTSHPFWQLLNDSGVPFVHHVGGGGRLLDRAFHNNGMPVTDHLGGGENIRSKDFLAINHSPSLFLGVAHPRRALRPVPRPPWGRHRGGRELGRVLDAPARLRPALVPSHRGAAHQARAPAVGVRHRAPQVHPVPGRARRAG